MIPLSIICCWTILILESEGGYYHNFKLICIILAFIVLMSFIIFLSDPKERKKGGKDMDFIIVNEKLNKRTKCK